MPSTPAAAATGPTAPAAGLRAMPSTRAISATGPTKPDASDERRIAYDFLKFKLRNLKRHPRSAVRFDNHDNKLIVAMCEEADTGWYGTLRIDRNSDQTRVHHRDCVTGAPVVSILDEFAEHVAAYLLRMRRQKLDASR